MGQITTDVPDVLAGRYELGPLIGRGGMGEVRRARDRLLEREVAIKFLRPDLADDPDARSRFEAEARNVAPLGHPNVVTVFDTGEAEGRVYIVMESLSGRTLADELAAGPLDPDRVRAVALDVLGALSEAHDRGLLHRDVKPSNVLLAGPRSVKVTDFGIAKSADASVDTATGMLLGTPAYVAPERLDGRPASPQSDLYAVGVLMYEALTGRPPFEADTPLAMVKAISTTQPEPVHTMVDGVDEQLVAVVGRALQKDPAARFASAREMAAALIVDPGEDTAVVDATAVPAPDGDETTQMTAVRPQPPTRAMSPPARGADATGPQTSRSPVPPSRIDQALDMIDRGVTVVAAHWARLRSPARHAVVVGVLVALLGVVYLAGTRDSGSDGVEAEPSVPAAEDPPQAGGGADLPVPLDEAIAELEREVRP